ncbi:FadR/GntR family transcriptional regulator [Streptomyces hoynatensis]|uniref:FadR family transcriptional regulator n=1 Tax=Streptomyces hoynatensis TaxID=1141874 RepID=A0A3A9ZEE6_9ACTN|nr:FadR/GntR family transcriptional regulator [Streptomyces hoynatensis]RKN46723.1 FadR family transcriptional regulator [Streptomyces hoynatensis]
MARRMMSEEVQGQIKELILHRRLAPGDPLPTESELMSLFGVSRNSVREALKALQALNIVDIRHGFGTYVGTLSLESFVDGVVFRAAVRHRRGEASLYELLEVREALEAGLISDVAGKVPAADLATLRELVGTMERESAVGRVTAATDRAFHLALYRSVGNHLLSEVLDAFWAAFHRVREELREDREDPRVTCARHHDILEALEAGDGARAAAAMRHHFAGIRQLLTPPGDGAPGPGDGGHGAGDGGRDGEGELGRGRGPEGGRGRETGA